MYGLDVLEPRRLFAGVTVITHGYDDNTTGWVTTMADAIAKRAGGKADVAIYTLVIGQDSDGTLGVLDLEHQAGTATMTTAATGETIIKLDWSTVSTGNFSTVQVGDVAAAWLMTPDDGLPAMDELPIHLIGHSRGASLNTEIAKDLGQHDIWVDQVTSLDPHPVDGGSLNQGTNFGDEPMTTWTNVVFADNYWRTSGNNAVGDPNGESVPGAYNVSLAASVQADPGASPHQSVHAWYYGTIELHATSDGTGISIPSTWYGTSPALPARGTTGFDYSLIAGGARPKAGLAPAFGGTATRVSPGQEGTQWPDIGGISLSTDLVTPGNKLEIAFDQQDPLSRSTITFFLDTDQNPFNSNSARTLADDVLPHAASVKPEDLAVNTKSLHKGEYYLCAEITGANGLVRYAYAPGVVKVK